MGPAEERRVAGSAVVARGPVAVAREVALQEAIMVAVERKEVVAREAEE